MRVNMSKRGNSMVDFVAASKIGTKTRRLARKVSSSVCAGVKKHTHSSYIGAAFQSAVCRKDGSRTTSSIGLICSRVTQSVDTPVTSQPQRSVASSAISTSFRTQSSRIEAEAGLTRRKWTRPAAYDSPSVTPSHRSDSVTFRAPPLATSTFSNTIPISRRVAVPIICILPIPSRVFSASSRTADDDSQDRVSRRLRMSCRPSSKSLRFPSTGKQNSGSAGNLESSIERDSAAMEE
mmetsp:Transcript_35901/g.101010  ORF Transcript_35901/g.101010 Transcript_35901/m.101010 type:complete len:236 (-) Transcript_35901:391-1098(-)